MSAMKRFWLLTFWPFDIAYILQADAHVTLDSSFYVCYTSSHFHLCVCCVFKETSLYMPVRGINTLFTHKPDKCSFSFSAARCFHTEGFLNASAIQLFNCGYLLSILFCVFPLTEREKRTHCCLIKQITINTVIFHYTRPNLFQPLLLSYVFDVVFFPFNALDLVSILVCVCL